jgi:predicted nucleotidyltransferase
MVVLFGSYAGGELPVGPHSDVDLAVLPGRVRPSLLDVHAALVGATSASLDLVWLDEADPLFRWEILQHAELLYGDIDDFLDYRAFAFRDFTDSADLRALEAELLKRKLIHLRELERAD